jgi:hypothetical protein
MASRMAAYATLLTREEYLPGVLVLNHSMKAVRTKYPLIVMITPIVAEDDRVLNALNKAGLRTHEVDTLIPGNKLHSSEDYEVRFKDTWTKLR